MLISVSSWPSPALAASATEDDRASDAPFQATLLASLLDHPLDLASDPLDQLLAIPGITASEIAALEETRLQGMSIRTMADLEELLGPAAALRIEPFVLLVRDGKTRGHLQAGLSGTPVRDQSPRGSIAFADRLDSFLEGGIRVQPGDSLVVVSKHLAIETGGSSLRLGDLAPSSLFSCAWARSSFQTRPGPGVSLSGFRLQGGSASLGSHHRLQIAGHARGSRGGFGLQGDTLREQGLFLATGTGPFDLGLVRSDHHAGGRRIQCDLVAASFTHSDSFATRSLRVLGSRRSSDSVARHSRASGYAVLLGNNARWDGLECRTSAWYRSAEFVAPLGNGALGRTRSAVDAPLGEGWQFSSSVGARLARVHPEAAVRISRPGPDALSRSISGGASSTLGAWSAEGRLAWLVDEDPRGLRKITSLLLAPELRASPRARLGLRWTRDLPSSEPAIDVLAPWASIRGRDFMLSGSLTHSPQARSLAWELSETISAGAGPKSRAPLQLDVRLSGQALGSGSPLRLTTQGSYRW